MTNDDDTEDTRHIPECPPKAGCTECKAPFPMQVLSEDDYNRTTVRANHDECVTMEYWWRQRPHMEWNRYRGKSVYLGQAEALALFSFLCAIFRNAKEQR